MVAPEASTALSGAQRRAVAAVWLGWGFDVFDALLINFVAANAIPTLLQLPLGTPEAKAATAKLQREFVEPRTKQLEAKQAEIRDLQDKLQRAGNITPEDVKLAAQRYFNTGNYVQVVLNPEDVKPAQKLAGAAATTSSPS